MSAAPRLLCFHHAGAGVSSFARWQGAFGETAEVVPVLLPGRGPRVRERRLTDPDELVAELVELLGPLLDRPYLFYGHSLGGLVAHTFTAALEAAGARTPELLVVGAVLPPHLRSPLLRSAGLPRRELLELLVSYGTVPPEALADVDGIYRRHVLPALIDDLKLGEALCRSGTDKVLRTPLVALAGRYDPIAPVPGMAEWDRYAPGDFGLRTVKGDHFFVRERWVPGMLRDLIEERRAGSATSRAHIESAEEKSWPQPSGTER
ncbi:thioesterase [Streptomyces sp. WAC 01529]|uniref:thioesterase II family protein n=1 Tax=Streptomyces sp. WAC 01529 TaxID=2203205 RepID=UPI000F6B6E5C|nr:alpha/beta fold hydrolase [Streptomyces sp. WAC 01529]AZM55058.1 thioesterase [Streptomyces sp. WAC 01529]